jgi:hypothetical protein
MIKKLIRKGYGKTQLIGAPAGAFTGLVLLLGVIQFYIDMQSYMKLNADLIDPEFIVINKRISLINTLDLGKATFSDKEIEDIRHQAFADRVEGFISNQFALSAFTENNNFPDLYTDLFFEAIPDEYLDVKYDNWKWNEGDKTIPIILPQDYLNLYNFGFAPSQGLPQVSSKTVSRINFKVTIRGKGKSAEYNGKVIGFSNRINSILVPYSFLSWANKEFGNDKNKRPSRLVIVTKDPTDPAIVKYLDARSYETIREKLKSSRLNIILKFIISILGSLGFLIILLAFFVFILSFQLLIARSSDEIRKLSWLGYNYIEISKPFLIKLLNLVILIAGSSFIAIVFLRKWMFSYLNSIGMKLDAEIHYSVWLGGVFILWLIFMANALIILRNTRRIG